MVGMNGEALLTMTDAVKVLPGRPNVATLWRWRTRGVRGIRLETVLVGGRRYTSHEALERFSEQITAIANGEPLPHRTNRQRAAAIGQAERELNAAGI